MSQKKIVMVQELIGDALAVLVIVDDSARGDTGGCFLEKFEQLLTASGSHPFATVSAEEKWESIFTGRGTPKALSRYAFTNRIVIVTSAPAPWAPNVVPGVVDPCTSILERADLLHPRSRGCNSST